MIVKVFAVAVMLAVGANAQALLLSTQLASIRMQINNCDGKFVCSVTQTTRACTVQCIVADQVCDYTAQCANGADEHHCPRMCEGGVICADKRTCAKPCDGITHCPGGEDEKNCGTKCPKPQVLCSDRVTCATVCDGTKQCKDEADENNCPPTCTTIQVLCSDGSKCATPCNGVGECPDNSDELNCPFQCKCTPGQYICLASHKCLPRADVCEGQASMPITPGDGDTSTTSCFTGGESGDDEGNSGFGFECYTSNINH